MANFYFPKIMTVSSIPLIVYPCVGLEEVLDRKDKSSIEDHIQKVYDKQNIIKGKGQYHILILWAYEGKPMTDVWIFDKLESWGSGPIVDVKIFREFDQVTDIGVSAGDGLLVLGREEEQRRKSKTITEYINGKRPTLPDDIAPKEVFYIS